MCKDRVSTPLSFFIMPRFKILSEDVIEFENEGYHSILTFNDFITWLNEEHQRLIERSYRHGIYKSNTDKRRETS